MKKDYSIKANSSLKASSTTSAGNWCSAFQLCRSIVYTSGAAIIVTEIGRYVIGVFSQDVWLWLGGPVMSRLPNMLMQLKSVMRVYSYLSLLNYLSHCYTIAWDRLSNQFLFVCVCIVCMYVSVGTLTVAFFNRSSRNLVRTFGVWIGRND